MGIYQYTLRADTKDVGALTIGHYQFAYKHSSWPNPALERKMASASYHAERAREKVTTRYFVVGRWEYAVEGLPIFELADAPAEFTEELRHAPIVGVLRKIDGRYRVTAPDDWMVACNDRLRERLA